MKKCNIYRNGKLTRENISYTEACKYTGINTSNFSRYIGKTHHCQGYDYLIEPIEEETEREITMRPTFEREWDDARFRINPRIKFMARKKAERVS
jgi:hypothetical protein